MFQIFAALNQFSQKKLHNRIFMLKFLANINKSCATIIAILAVNRKFSQEIHKNKILLKF